MATDDRILIQRMARGDHSAFDELYTRHRDWILRQARRHTGDDDIALDVLQETILYLVRSAPELNLRADLRVFLYPVIRNLSITLQQRARRHAPNPGHVPETVSATPQHDGTPAPLHDAINDLSDIQREIIMLRFRERLHLHAIAEALEIPLNTAKSRLHQALSTLRSDPRAQELFKNP